MLISASITRDSSPPEATSRSGPGGHAGVRADQELDGVAAAPGRSGPAAPRRRSAAPRSRTSNVASAIASSAELGAHRLRERRGRPSRAPRAGAPPARSSAATWRSQLCLQPRRRLAGVREPVALGAAALGVLEHRFDRAAVLSLQPRELLEALLDRREAPRVGLERRQVGAQLGGDVLQLVRDRLRARCERAERLVAVAGAAQLARPRPPAAPSRRASPSRWDRSPRTPRRRRDGASPPRPAGRARAPARAPRPRPGRLPRSPRSRTRGSRGRAPARRAGRASPPARARSRGPPPGGARTRSARSGAPRRRTRPGSRAAPRPPSACGARAGRRRPPAARRPRAAPARTRSGPAGTSASGRRAPRGGRAPAPARRAGCARPARPAPGPPRAPAGGSKTPSTYASSAPGRTMPRRGLPPSSRSSAWASIVLPAPVSPVIAFRPRSRASSALSISSRFRTRSSTSTRYVYQPPRSGARRYEVSCSSFSRKRR